MFLFVETYSRVSSTAFQLKGDWSVYLKSSLLLTQSCEADLLSVRSALTLNAGQMTGEITHNAAAEVGLQSGTSGPKWPPLKNIFQNTKYQLNKESICSQCCLVSMRTHSLEVSLRRS